MILRILRNSALSLKGLFALAVIVRIVSDVTITSEGIILNVDDSFVWGLNNIFCIILAGIFHFVEDPKAGFFGNISAK